MCALSQELDTKAPPWTRPAGLSLAGGLPLRGVFPLVPAPSADSASWAQNCRDILNMCGEIWR